MKLDPTYHTCQSPASGLVVVGKDTQLPLIEIPAPADPQGLGLFDEPILAYRETEHVLVQGGE